MYRLVLITVLLIAATCFGLVLFDLVKEYTTGYYEGQVSEVFVKASALALYAVLAFRFCNNRLSLFK